MWGNSRRSGKRTDTMCTQASWWRYLTSKNSVKSILDVSCSPHSSSDTQVRCKSVWKHKEKSKKESFGRNMRLGQAEHVGRGGRLGPWHHWRNHWHYRRAKICPKMLLTSESQRSRNQQMFNNASELPPIVQKWSHSIPIFPAGMKGGTGCWLKSGYGQKECLKGRGGATEQKTRSCFQ